MKPVIAVPHWRAPTWERTKYYYDSILAAGADYRLVDGDDLPPETSALLLTGGADVDPKLYGEPRHPATERSNTKRDEQELGLLQEALDRDMPVLCICRGHQLLNVGLGGSLLQDIEGPGHKWNQDMSSGWHPVRLAPDSRIGGIYGEEATLKVNSRHHQGVTQDRLAPALRATAFSTDGFVECEESAEHRWVIGVQWHPERPEMHPHSQPLWQAFVQASCARPATG